MRSATKPVSILPFDLIIVVQKDLSVTKQYKNNNNSGFKYRDDRTKLPAFFSDSAVISRGGLDNSPCPVCDVAEGQSNLAPQMSSDNRMLLRIQSRKLQHTQKTDVNAKCVCHQARTVCSLHSVHL